MKVPAAAATLIACCISCLLLAVDGFRSMAPPLSSSSRQMTPTAMPIMPRQSFMTSPTQAIRSPTSWLQMAAEESSSSEESKGEEDEDTTPIPAPPAASNETKSLASKIFAAYVKTADVATTLFPVWTVLFTGIALKKPTAFAWFTTEYFTAGLAALMLSMGITLTPDDFVAVAQKPVPVVMQFALCYLMMPLLAMGLGKAFGLSDALLAGMVLVGSINGGQASNLCTYIARGNVALSVLMTTATTIGAIFMTPLLCQALLGAVVPVDAAGIALSTIQVVLAPIAIGMLTNRYFPKVVEKVLPFAPVVGVVSTCLLVASAVAQVATPILNAGWGLQIPVLLLHLVGGLVGYFLPRITGFDEVSSRTMAIETSMKSSAFGFLLAKLHFGNYAARVPSAVSVVWMALTGSLLAVVWRFIPVKTNGGDQAAESA